MKKKEPELAQVNQAVLQHLPPEHVEVEIWRADALEVRRGLSSELDEMWRPRSGDRPLYALRGGLSGAGASSTDSNIAANIERGFCPKKRSAAVVPSGRVRKKL